jgi:hypothetical protein
VRGIFASAREDIEGLRRQLRRLLRVQTEEGKTLLFRFYDPRVLRLYLPSAEIATVFGLLLRTRDAVQYVRWQRALGPRRRLSR